MPTAITLAGTSFTAPLIPALPTLTNMDGWAYFGGSLAASQNVGTGGAWTNHSSGPPTYFSNYIRCVNGAGALQTPISNRATETILVAARQIPVGSPVGAYTPMVGTLAGGAGSGFCAYRPLTGSVGLQFSLGATLTLNLVTPVITEWKFMAFVVGPGGPASVYDLTRATSATGATVSNPVTANLKTIGTDITTNAVNNGSCDIAFFANFGIALTKPQIDQVYASVKASLALRGITV